MVNELKRVVLDFSKNGSFLLINKILLFQYSEGIYSVSTRALALKVAQNDHALTALYNAHRISGQIPRDAWE